MILVRSALENPDSGASNGGSNLLIRPFGADLVTFEMVELSHYCRDFYQWISRFWSYPATSKVTRSAPNSRINKLDTPFDAPSSGSSSAFRINIVRQTLERMKHFLWKPRLKSTTNCDGAHETRGPTWNFGRAESSEISVDRGFSTYFWSRILDVCVMETWKEKG